MDEYRRHIDLLGFRATDKVTGYSGVIDTISFDLYGCVQAILKGGLDEKGEVRQGCWFDVARLDVDRSTRVVEPPNFERGYVAEGRKGPSDKPAQRA